MTKFELMVNGTADLNEKEYSFWLKYYSVEKANFLKSINKSVLEYYEKELQEHIESLPSWEKLTNTTQYKNKMALIAALKEVIKQIRGGKENEI